MRFCWAWGFPCHLERFRFFVFCVLSALFEKRLRIITCVCVCVRSVNRSYFFVLGHFRRVGSGDLKLPSGSTFKIIVLRRSTAFYIMVFHPKHLAITVLCVLRFSAVLSRSRGDVIWYDVISYHIITGGCNMV